VCRLFALVANELFAASAKGQIKEVGLPAFYYSANVADDLNGTLKLLAGDWVS